MSLNRLIKRGFDLACVAVGIAFFGPISAAITLLIYWEDGRPILFFQERVGRHRRRFQVAKFRTMRDGRVTRVGAVLRATGLDELAQFWNVLRGEVSMVGPRPLTELDIARLGWNRPDISARWSVKPGVTGLAQVYGGLGAAHSRRLDLLYARRVSVWVDFKIVVITLCMNFLGKRRVRRWLSKAYRRVTGQVTAPAVESRRHAGH